MKSEKVKSVYEANKLIDKLEKDSKNCNIQMISYFGELKVLWKTKTVEKTQFTY